MEFNTYTFLADEKDGSGYDMVEDENGATTIEFGDGDYLVIPRGVLHRYRYGDGPHRFLVVESAGYVRTPKRYRNEHGQLTEEAPFSERDYRLPTNLKTVDEQGEFPVIHRELLQANRIEAEVE